MPDYRRNRVPGGTYFFTVNLRDRASNLLTTHIAELREALRATRARAPFHVDAWVVLPDHMHAIWTLPEGDVDYPGRANGFSDRRADHDHAQSDSTRRSASLHREPGRIESEGRAVCGVDHSNQRTERRPAHERISRPAGIY